MAIGFSGSKYEDLDKLSYVSGIDITLTNKFNGFYERQMELFNLSVGRIFSNADLKKLIAENRPHFPTNFFMTTINALAGNFKNNAPELSFIPSTPDDEPLVEIVKDLNHYLMNQANKVDYEIGKAFIYAIIANISWIKSVPSQTKDGDNIISIEAYNPFRIAFDTENFRRDLKKTKYIRDAGWYTPEEIIQIYANKIPDLEEEIRQKSIDVLGESAFDKNKRVLLSWLERVFNASLETISGKDTGGFDINNLKANLNDFVDKSNNRLKVMDFYERRMIRCMDLYDFKTGNKFPITDLIKKDDESNEVQKSGASWYDNAKLQLVRSMYPNSQQYEYFDEKIFQISTVPGLFLKVFEGEQDIQSKYFNFTPVVAYDHHPDPMELTGVVEQIAPKIKSYNLRENTLLTYLMRQTHSSWILSDKLAKTHGKYFRSNAVGEIIQVPENAIEGKDYQRVEPPASIAGLERFAENDKEDWKILGGTRDSVQGRNESTGESGKLAAIRVQQSNLMHEHISDNAQNAYLMLSKINLQYMKKYMTEPRMIRIMKNDADPYWLQINMPILGKIQNDISSAEVDVEISLSPFGKQAQEIQEEKSFQMANFLASNFGPQYVPIKTVLENSTLGGKQKWISHIEQIQQQEALAMQQQQEQMQADQEFNDQSRTLDLQTKANQVIQDKLATQMIGM